MKRRATHSGIDQHIWHLLMVRILRPTAGRSCCLSLGTDDYNLERPHIPSVPLWSSHYCRCRPKAHRPCALCLPAIYALLALA